jgi:formylglycine-generating enzyme required for sulfatase activity
MIAAALLCSSASIATELPAFKDCDACPEMIVLPADSFDMGASPNDRKAIPEEHPRHRVAIARFAIGKFEVTFAQWGACVAVARCAGPSPDKVEPSSANLPVLGIKREDALAYVAWLSEISGRRYRLPTEAEWEYAARAGTTTTYWWGDSAGKANAKCRDCDEPVPRPMPAPVGSFPANAFGLHDMLGNIHEQVADCWHSDYVGAPAEGAAWIDGGDCRRRVMRGGSFLYETWGVRSSARAWLDDGYAFVDSGLRVAASLD